MYNICRCKIRTGFKNEKWFDIITGVMQGSVLSHLLFIAFLNVVIKNVKQEITNFDGGIMAYADDLACWSENGETIENIIQCFHRHLTNMGLRMNVETSMVTNVTMPTQP
jgi:hypothetical protein